MKIALLGASSHVAKGLISQMSRLHLNDFKAMSLYAREPAIVSAWIDSVLHYKKSVLPISTFGTEQFDCVINTIGISDTHQLNAIGNQVFEINRQYDEKVMKYLDYFPKSKYIYVSSGAVYGGDFKQPVNEASHAIVNLNNALNQDWYGLAKISSEIRHRARSDLAIVDVRVYGYMSPWISLDKPFFLANAANALRNGKVLNTSQDDFWRDYVGPAELEQVIYTVMDKSACNMSLDVYSAAPILKSRIIEILTNHFGLNIELMPAPSFDRSPSPKYSYFTLDRRAADLGFSPFRTSEQVVIEEMSILLNQSKLHRGGKS